ncbi:MAG: hypothetical protein R6X32_23915 [Chloroflexota bacterium]
MSQLRNHAFVSRGQRDKAFRITFTREEFVQVVLELTVAAYQAMNQANIAQPDWPEDTFTINLATYLRTIGFDQELSIRVHTQVEQYTEAIRTGQGAPKSAKKIDLVLYEVWERDYDRVHFAWEAKLVGDKRVNPNYSGLNSAYANEAIYRFIRGDYAASLPDAGVLGYVMAGDVVNIVHDINSSMGRLRRNQPLSASNHLRLAAPIAEFEQVYRSEHQRVTGLPIKLYHLFLQFAFD